MIKKEEFTRATYIDGDKDYLPPRWRKNLDEYKLNRRKLDFASMGMEDSYIGVDEVALKHPHTQSIVKLSDDGFVDLFAGSHLGIRIDPNTNSLNLFGDNINLIGGNVNIKEQASGLSKSKKRYSNEIVDALKELGLPADYED